ncbi:hypothetical protein [Rodentibacter myodis]|uniref:DUF8095 domain-containing protein n=1 Tax=Rodentibacter myodis TaxID=1907939 RepID=A0A1V3JSI6_9PAST|nr:hypothetical protein [Rodentibacter myodis]OOF59668.1 hypothetical protein BKL49_02425 [Rodentibacter myodis]
MNHRKKINTYILFFSTSSIFSFSTFVNATNQPVNETGSDVSLTLYVDGATQRSSGMHSSEKDTKKLAHSIEFEVYTMNEESSSHSVYVSPAGICKGFEGDYGVDFTNTTNNYVNRGDNSQYYGGITGASLYQKDDAKNVQYVPVYVIRDAQLEKEIREREGKQTKQVARSNISTGEEFLDKTICNTGGK